VKITIETKFDVGDEVLYDGNRVAKITRIVGSFTDEGEEQTYYWLSSGETREGWKLTKY